MLILIAGTENPGAHSPRCAGAYAAAASDGKRRRLRVSTRAHGHHAGQRRRRPQHHIHVHSARTRANEGSHQEYRTAADGQRCRARGDQPWSGGPVSVARERKDSLAWRSPQSTWRCGTAWRAPTSVSLAHLLGGLPKPTQAYGAIGYDGADESAKAAEGWAQRGFRGVKAKIGYPTVAEDIAVIRAIRRAAGEETAVMVDYNQSLTPSEAVAATADPRCRRAHVGRGAFTRARLRRPREGGSRGQDSHSGR